MRSHLRSKSGRRSKAPPSKMDHEDKKKKTSGPNEEEVEVLPLPVFVQQAAAAKAIR